MQCALMAESRGRVRVDGGEQRGGRWGIRGALTAEPCTKKFVDVYNSVLCSSRDLVNICRCSIFFLLVP